MHFIYSTIVIGLLSLFQATQQTLPGISKEIEERYGYALEAIFGMGLRTQSVLQSQNSENFLISPISAALMIGQLMLGAEGDLNEYLYQLLSLPKPLDGTQMNQYSKNGENSTYTIPHTELHLQLGSLVRDLRKNPSMLFTLRSTNVIFINKHIWLRKEFKYETQFLYDTEVVNVNFAKQEEALRLINSWAYYHTKGLIKNILPSPPAANTAAIFANAIYFLGEWEQPFSSEVNTNDVFYVNENKVVDVTYMTGLLEEVPYYESKKHGCKMMVLPYKNRELGLYLVLPLKGHKYEYDLKKFIAHLGVNNALEMITNLKNRDVTVRIPKLNLSTSLSLLDTLKKYATYKKLVKNVTSAKQDVFDAVQEVINKFQNFNSSYLYDIVLKNAAENRDLVVNDVVQQMAFAVNEKGTEAAAITASVINYNAGSKSFQANKPFTFWIRHEATGATIFWGAINNPNA